MSKIKIMDEILANKIAAGEVVEKISSVVKELVENSIDAKSNEIKIDLVDSGLREIKVIDNGIGMDKEDAVNCFLRHATSKLLNEDDLFNINSLGFRGEALASIASVSEVTLSTSSGDIGTEVIVNGGKLISVNAGTARRGTVISVKNLFYNTPARLKHLKSIYTELSNVVDYVNKIALSHTNIKFVLTNNGNTLLNTDGSDNLLKTINSIFGTSIARLMMSINSKNDDYIIEGYMSKPEVHKSNRNSIIVIVNGRVVRNSEVNRVINDAYHGFKPDNRFPVIVLRITVDPTLIDVNIHPTKMDIKFSKMDTLLLLIEEALKKELYKKNLTPKAEIINEISNEDDKETINKPVYQEFKLNFDIPINEDVKEYVINDSINNNEEEVKDTEKFPVLYPIGAIHGTYIICQNEDGMYLIDQHAAKERCNYEKVKKSLGEVTGNSIDLIVPITMEYTTNEFIILKNRFDILNNLKFDIEEFGVNSIIIKAHPTWLRKGYEEESIKRIIEILINNDKEFSIEKFNEKISIDLSCKMSIKANDYISNEEIDNLLLDMKNCENPFHCPHGRPTMIKYSKHDLEKLFKRSGF